jgi:hypothetical protein
MNGKSDLVSAWLEKAERDIGIARLIHTHIPRYRDMIAFHCGTLILLLSPRKKIFFLQLILPK